MPAVADVAAAGLSADDLVLLSVKSFDTELAMTGLQRATRFELPVFCAQNGVRKEVAVPYSRRVRGVMVMIEAKRELITERAARRQGQAVWPCGSSAPCPPPKISGHRFNAHARPGLKTILMTKTA